MIRSLSILFCIDSSTFLIYTVKAIALEHYSSFPMCPLVQWVHFLEWSCASSVGSAPLTAHQGRNVPFSYESLIAFVITA